MREALRDKTRDKLAQNLFMLGSGAEMAERGRAEEKIEKAWFERSLGVIDIPHGPVRWINIIKKDGSKNSPPYWRIVFGIPDERPVPEERMVHIKTVRKKSFPLFGKVVDVTWKGEDRGIGLISILDSDMSVKQTATELGNLEIRSHNDEFRGWTVKVDRRINPSALHWDTFKKLADHVLTSPRIM